MNTHISYFSVALATFVLDAELGSLEILSDGATVCVCECENWTDRWVEWDEAKSTDAWKAIGRTVRSVCCVCDGQHKWDGFTFNRQKRCVYGNECVYYCVYRTTTEKKLSHQK